MDADGEVPMAAVAPPGAVAVAVPPPPAGPVATNWIKVHLRLAQLLLVLGFAAAALAMFAINSSSPTAAAAALGPCAPTESEVADMRAASEALLLAAAAQVLGAATAVLAPACQLITIIVTVFLSWLTGYCASDVLWFLVACHGELHGDLLVHYRIFLSMFGIAYLVAFIASICGPCLPAS